MTIPVAIGTAVGHPAEGVIIAAGALPAGVAAFGGGGVRSRSSLILATALGMTVSTFVGGIVAGHTTATIGALVVWGFSAGITVVLGREASIVGTQAIIGLVVFGRFPGSVATSAVHAAYVFAGAGLQGALAATLRSPQRFAAERRTLASAYSELALLAADPDRPSISAGSEAASATALLARRQPSQDVDILRGLADEAKRIRLELQSTATALQIPGVRDGLDAAAGWLRAVATALANGTAAPDEAPALAGVADRLRGDRDAAPPGRAGTRTRYAAARIAALLGQLRAVDRLAGVLAGVQRFALPRGLGAPAFIALPQRTAAGWRQVRTALRDRRSPAFRHAIRLAVVLPGSELLSHALPWQRGYWITLTAVVVLKPDYAATTRRGLDRVAGTALGVLAAGLLVATTHPSGAVLVPLIAIAAWAAYASFEASYALYTLAVTAIVVFLLAPIVGNELSTVADRGLDTLVGGAIATLAYVVWPTWERETLAASLAQLLEALAAYADSLLGAYEDPESLDRGRLGDLAGTARRARMAALASYDRAVAEPTRARAEVDLASGVLSATRRIVIELHALRATLADATDFVAVPEVAQIRKAITHALRLLAQRQTVAVTDLRELQQVLAEESDDLSSLAARRRALLAAHLDPLVDSVDTLAHVLQGRDL